MSNSVPSEGSWEAINKWFKNNRSHMLFFLAGLTLYVLLGVFLWWLLQLYVDPSAIKDPSKEATVKKDLLQALGLIMAGVAGAIGIYFTWRGQRLTQESTQETLLVTREGQVTDRFTRAIDQLGKTQGDDGKTKSLEIRLGGIYALERIAKESEEDYWPIMEILTAYVRRNAPLPPEDRQDDKDEAKQHSALRGIGRRETNEDLDPDISAVMTILRRRTRSYGHGEPEPLDLNKTNLSQADLREANLSQADLRGVNLSQANLFRTDLYEADLSEADLSEAAADLSGANFRGADLTLAKLRGANLSKAKLTGACLRGADLSRVNLTRADLKETIPSMGTLYRGADLSEAILSDAHLTRALLCGVNFRGANLFRADLTFADLTRADLTDAKVTHDQLEKCVSLKGATMPDGSKHS